MNSKERERHIKNLYFDYQMRLDRSGEWMRYMETCARAVIGAADILGRDPLELAREMSDGRLGHLIRDGAIGLPLEFATPNSRYSPSESLRKAAGILAQERERLERRSREILDQWAAIEKELGTRAHKEDRAQMMGIGLAWSRQDE